MIYEIFQVLSFNLVVSMMVFFVSTAAEWFVRWKINRREMEEFKRSAKNQPVDAGRVFLRIEADRRRREQMPIRNPVMRAKVKELRRARKTGRKPRDELHELGVVNRLSEAHRARFEYEKRGEIN